MATKTRVKLENPYKDEVELAKRFPDIETSHFACLVPADPNFKSGFGTGYPAYWGIFTRGQKGYEVASERFPYLDEADLEAAVIEHDDNPELLREYLKVLKKRKEK